MVSGAELCSAWQGAGARVAVAEIDSQAAAETVSMIDASAASQSIAITADVADVEQIDRMVATAVERFGQLDVMVNNAGVTRRADIMDLTEEDFDRINRVNFKGVFFGLQRAGPRGDSQTRGSDRQHRLDRGPGLCRRLQRHLCGTMRCLNCAQTQISLTRGASR